MFFVLFIMINLYFTNFACKECGKHHNTKRVLGGDSDMFIMDLEIHNLA